MQGLTQAFRLRSYSHGVYKLKEMRKEEKSILQALEVENLHVNHSKLKGFDV